MHDCVVIHYGEIGLKGGNRPFFENRLVENLRKATGAKAEREYGRIIAENKNTRALKNVTGIAFFSPALRAQLDIDDIKEKALKVGKQGKKKTFAVISKRSNKNFRYNSRQLNEIVGDHIRRKLKMKVDLGRPQKKVYIEIGEKAAYIYDRKIKGPGGLPVGVSGKVVCLLSGGIDSPVASYMMMKRGCTVVFLHFHNYMSKIDEKVGKIVSVLNRYQMSSTLYMVPFFPIQEKIIEKIPERHRMIVYRRMMLRIAERIMDKEGAKAVVTGDSVAQVASQTLDNIASIRSASDATVLSPLIGMDKQETIEIAKSIGTYELSIMPYQDCCSYMIAKHPETRAKTEDVIEMEKALDVEDLVNYGTEKAERKVI